MSEGPYSISISHNILNHLGRNLYNNIPAVVSEIVANAWDADAENVKIEIDKEKGCITITDDGEGMSVYDCNQRFLKIGYDRRKQGRAFTKNLERHVMGRKGIGKLSMFAIADLIEVHSIKTGDDGTMEKSGFIMDANAIEKLIEDEKKCGSEEKNYESVKLYEPTPVETQKIDSPTGTKIILRELKKDITRLESYLRKNIARRFSIIGKENNFSVYVNDREIGIEDRDYFNKLQFIWTLGEKGKTFLTKAKSVDQSESLDGIVNEELGYYIDGWIGTVKKQNQIEEGNNTISILAWGKLVHEDLLKDMKEAGFYAEYLIGEIRADFLDGDDDDDIVTSARQSVKENDPRYLCLKEAVRKILKHIQGLWSEWRESKSKEEALKNDTLREWYESLSEDSRIHAEGLFKKIESFNVPDEGYKKEIYKYGILAFERLKLRKELSKLNQLKTYDELKYAAIFNGIADIEAALYHEIAVERLEVIDSFAGLVDDNAKEKVLQDYVFDHLWLLHPSWERAAQGTGRKEEQIKKAFKDVTDELTKDEERGRPDVRYRTAAGKHIIIEFKRASVSTTVVDLYKQIIKYKTALEKCLEITGEKANIEVICILGQPVKSNDPDEEDRFLKGIGARIIYYDQLIEESQESYRDYIDKQPELQRIKKLVDNL